MKSYVDELTHVYRHLFIDVLYCYPHLRRNLVKDRKRFVNQIRCRGLPFLTHDLVEACEWFDNNLDIGRLSKPVPRHCRGTKFDRRPQFLRGLYKLIFDKHGGLLEDCDHNAVAFIRQIYLLAKKIKLPCKEKYIVQEIKKFQENDRRLPRFRGGASSSFVFAARSCGNRTITTTGPNVGLSGRSDHRRNLLVFERTADYMCRALGQFDIEQFKGRHGPGVTSRPFMDNNKYKFINWSERLERSFPSDYWATSNLGVDSYKNLTEDDHESRLCVVPKTQRKPRLIAAEPYENMWCQQAIWSFLSNRVNRAKSNSSGNFFRKTITFGEQEHNRVLALMGSKDASIITVDLSAASDSISSQLVWCWFRKNPALRDALFDSRSNGVLMPDGKIFHMKKFATMGNASTFPVQSLIFTSLCVSAGLLYEDLAPTASNISRLTGMVRVFGDDCIVPTTWGGHLASLFDLFFLKINQSKTFTGSHFRESCGMDAFQGSDVTPAYWKQPLDGQKPQALVSMVAASNNFYNKGYIAVADYLRSTVTKVRRTIVDVPIGSGIFGFETRTAPNSSLPVRWNQSLHRREWLFTITATSEETHPIEDWTALLKFFTEEPVPDLDWKDRKSVV